MIAFRLSPRSPIGIDIGSQSVTLVQLAGRPGEMTVSAAATGALDTDEVLNESDRTDQLCQLIRDLMLEHQFRGRNVVSCLGSTELFVQNVRIPQIPAEELDGVVRLEAEERLPYPIEDAEIRHLLAAQVRQDADVKQEVILLATRRARVNRHLELLERAGLRPAAVDAEPCALVRALGQSDDAGSDTELERTAYLHLGETSTAVLFAEGHQVLFLKYIQIGGRQLDQAVSRHMGTTLNEASRMRRFVNTASKLDSENEIHRSVIEAIRGPLDAIGTEIELCLRYYKVTFRGRPISQAKLSGREATLWLKDYLNDRLGIPCDVGNPFASFPDDSLPDCCLESPWQWATAIGLAEH